MGEVVTFNDALRLAILGLQGAGIDNVHSEVPGGDPAPTTYVLLSQTGGQGRLYPVHDRVRITADSRALSKPAAMALALQVRAAFWLIEGTVVDGVRISGISELASPAFMYEPVSHAFQVTQSFHMLINGADVAG